jgi:hypothetical protein
MEPLTNLSIIDRRLVSFSPNYLFIALARLSSKEGELLTSSKDIVNQV